MAKKKSSTFSRALIDIVVYAFSFFNNFKYKVIRLRSDVKIALQRIIKSVILAVFLGIMLATTWIAILAMIFLYILNIPTNPYLSLLVVILINLVVMIVIGLVMAKLMRNLSLQKFHLNIFDLE